MRNATVDAFYVAYSSYLARQRAVSIVVSFWLPACAIICIVTNLGEGHLIKILSSRPVTSIEAVRRKFASFAVVVIPLCLLFCGTQTFGRDLSFKDFPYLIYCEAQGVDRGFYFSRLGADGLAIYLSPDRQAGMITIDGVARRVGGEQSGSCSNKTLDDLRSSGQAYDLPRQ